MKKWTTYPLGICLLATSLSLSSCVEDKFDLNEDVDLTLSVGGENLSLPFGNTDPIYLKDFIKTEDAELLNVVQSGANEGEYYLNKSGVINASDVQVPNFNVPQKTIGVNLFTIYPMSNAPAFLHGDYTQTGIDVNFDYTFESANAPTELKLLKQVGIAGGRMAVELSFHIEGPINACDGFDLSGLTLHFPDFVQLEAGQAGVNMDNNTYSFAGQTLAKGVRDYSRTFYIESFDFSGEPAGGLVVQNNGTVSYTSNFQIEGSATVKDVYPSQVTEDIKVSPEVRFQSVQIASVTGRTDPQITIAPTSIDLNGIPDFLEDDDVVMDLANPMIVVTVTNPVDMPISLSATMQGLKSGDLISGSNVTVGEDYAKTAIILAANATTKIAISRLGTGGPSGSTNIQVSDLNNLIRKIPEQIRFTMAAHAVQNVDHTIELGRSYAIAANYDVDLSLSFGPDLVIVYKDTMDGWNDDLQDLEVKRLTITGDVDNIVPLGMSVIATPVNANKQILQGITISVPTAVNACNADGTASTTALTVDITAQEGTLKMLDGILLRVVANTGTATTGKPLNENQYIVLRNMAAKVPGGIIVNANDD